MKFTHRLKERFTSQDVVRLLCEARIAEAASQRLKRDEIVRITDELSGDVDKVYEVIPPGEKLWVAVEVDAHELYDYWDWDDTDTAFDEPERDVYLNKSYAKRLRNGEQPPPVILAGVPNRRARDRGELNLLDGRHRIVAAKMAGRKTVICMLPVDDLLTLHRAKPLGRAA